MKDNLLALKANVQVDFISLMYKCRLNMCTW